MANKNDNGFQQNDGTNQSEDFDQARIDKTNVKSQGNQRPNTDREMNARAQERVGGTPNRTGAGETSTSVSPDDDLDSRGVDGADQDMERIRKGARDSESDINS